MLSTIDTALAVALATADEAPRVIVDDRQILLSAWSEWIIEVVTEPCRLLPSILGVSEEHAQKVASAGPAIAATIRLTSVHDAQIVDELDVALLAVDLGAKPLCQVAHDVHSVHLLSGDRRHVGIALDQWCSQ